MLLSKNRRIIRVLMHSSSYNSTRMQYFNIFSAITICAILLYTFLKWKLTYWKRMGLDYIEPNLIFGNFKEMIQKKVSMGDKFRDVYNHFKAKGEKHGGIYLFLVPMYVPTDLDLIKDMLTRDFEYFMSHGVFKNDEGDPLSGHLFSLEDEKWRNLRIKLSPAFTSGKLKMMFQTLSSTSKGLIEVLEDHAKFNEVMNIKDIVARFTTDVIASIGFGLEANALKNPNEEFRQKGRRIFEFTRLERMKETFMFLMPLKIVNLLKLKLLPNEVNEFFLDVVRKTIDFREQKNISRKDFMHLLLQLKNRGKVVDDQFIFKQEGETDGSQYLSFNEIAAQCLLFFLAGFETSATTMSFALLELAINQDVQDKLREDIKRVMTKHNNELSYEAIMEMKYLDQVVYETLRKHPPTPILPRRCTKDYKVPGTNVTIQKGTQVMLPVLGIQQDPDIYPNPQKFDPERFSEENKANRHPAAFLTFGEGPRYCLGARLGLMQSKVGLIAFINNFRVNVHSKTQLPIKYVSERFILAMDGGIWLTVSKLK